MNIIIQYKKLIHNHRKQNYVKFYDSYIFIII